MTIRVVVTDRVRVAKKVIPKEDILDRYVIELFDESKCATCSNKEERGPDNELCQECPSFQGVHRFYNAREAKQGVWSLPQADTRGIRNYLDRNEIDYKWIDKRAKHKVTTPIKFKGKLYRKGDTDEEGNPRPDQWNTVRKWWKTKTGKIVARPRSGKTVMATFLYAKLGVRTVIIANQKELLNQFYETAVGVPAPRYLRGKFIPSNKKAGRTPVTNIRQMQKKTGKQIIFMPESYAHLEKFLKTEIPDILLIPYQSFIQDPRRVADVLNKYYSFAIIDEEHGTGADAYLRFAASLDMRYRLGLTATPNRKDGRSRLSALVTGPVVATTNTVTLKPSIEFYAVQARPKTVHKSWYGAAKWAKMSNERNVEIVKMTFSDLRNGYDVVIIPVEHKDHMNQLVTMINHQAKLNYRKKKENWPKDLAREFHSKVPDRLGVLNWVDSRDEVEKVHKKLPTKSPRVLVAIRGMIKQGVDMKRPSMLYCIVPMSAKYKVGAPMFQQLAFRVATPYLQKPKPVVRVFVDNIKMFAACSTSLLFHEVLPNSTMRSKEPLYHLPNYEQAKNMIAKRNSDPKKQAKKWWI